MLLDNLAVNKPVKPFLYISQNVGVVLFGATRTKYKYNKNTKVMKNRKVQSGE